MPKGIIYKSLSGFYYVKSDDETVECRARGRFRLEKNSPYVGDMVEFTETDKGKGVITTILPRKNIFERPPLANIDKMVIFASAAIPVTDPFLIDKMIVIALKNNCEPIICINKTDIDSADGLYELYAKVDITVVRTSATTGEGIGSLVEAIRNAVCAFTGNSGVGKSSILNTIEQDFDIKVDEVSKKLGRGRHTTRHVELYELSCGAFVADTPGFSAFGEGFIAGKEDLQHYFNEFEQYLGNCKFQDCAHIDEPDCAILTALQSGNIQKSRHDSYKRLYKQAQEYKEWEHKGG